MTTVLICDDQARVRNGLARSLLGVPGVDRVAVAASGDEAIARWAERRPALVLMGSVVAGVEGSTLTRRLLARHPEATVVILSDGRDRDSVALAIASGARGYLVRDADRADLVAAVAHALTELAPDSYHQHRPPAPSAPGLSERELQVLWGITEGKSNAEIGRDLFLAEDTIKTHVRRLFRKMGVNDRARAVAEGFRWGLVR